MESCREKQSNGGLEMATVEGKGGKERTWGGGIWWRGGEGRGG
jgi:hypothetical protein